MTSSFHNVWLKLKGYGMMHRTPWKYGTISRLVTAGPSTISLSMQIGPIAKEEDAPGPKLLGMPLRWKMLMVAQWL